MPIAEAIRELTKGAQRRRDLDDDGILGESGHRPFHHCGTRAVRDRVGDEVVTVALIAQREEDLTRADDARIERAAAVALVASWVSVDDLPARCIDEIVEREHD